MIRCCYSVFSMRFPTQFYHNSCCCLQVHLCTVVVIVLGWCTPRPLQPSSWPASWRNAPPTNTALTLSAMTWATPINNDLGHSVPDMTGVFWVIHWILFCLSKKKREVVLLNTFCTILIYLCWKILSGLTGILENFFEFEPSLFLKLRGLFSWWV